HLASLGAARSGDRQSVGTLDVALLSADRHWPGRFRVAIGGRRPAGIRRAACRRRTQGCCMNPMVAALMFPGMFLLIFLGIPVSLSLIIPALVAGWFAFGTHVFDQLYGGLYSAATN